MRKRVRTSEGEVFPVREQPQTTPKGSHLLLHQEDQLSLSPHNSLCFPACTHPATSCRDLTDLNQNGARAVPFWSLKLRDFLVFST